MFHLTGKKNIFTCSALFVENFLLSSGCSLYVGSYVMAWDCCDWTMLDRPKFDNIRIFSRKRPSFILAPAVDWLSLLLSLFLSDWEPAFAINLRNPSIVSMKISRFYVMNQYEYHVFMWWYNKMSLFNVMIKELSRWHVITDHTKK